MNIRSLVLTMMCASVAFCAAAPAFADDDWPRHEQHEWREHAWREHHWREHYYAPPVVVAPGYYSAPPVYYSNPGYYR